MRIRETGDESPRLTDVLPQGGPQGGRFGKRGKETGGGDSTMSDRLFGLDPKPGELPMARLKPR